MPLNLRLTIDVTAGLERMRRLEGQTSDLRDWFAERLSPMLTVFFSKMFTTRGSVGGVPWPQLANSTVERKRRGGYDPRPLVRTGDLMASFEATGPGAWEQLSPLAYERGTTVDYYRFHHTGTSRMPARQVIPDPFPSAEVDRWAFDLENWLAKE